MAHKTNKNSNGGCGCLSIIGYAIAIPIILMLIAFGLPGLIAMAIIGGVIAFFVIVALKFIGMITSQGSMM